MKLSSAQELKKLMNMDIYSRMVNTMCNNGVKTSQTITYMDGHQSWCCISDDVWDMTRKDLIVKGDPDYNPEFHIYQ